LLSGALAQPLNDALLPVRQQTYALGVTRMFTPGRADSTWQALEPAVLDLLRKGEDPARIAEVIKKSLPKAQAGEGIALAKRLRARAHHLSERGAFGRAFRRRLAKTWGEAFTLYEIVLVCATEAGSDFDAVYRPGAAKENDMVFEALVGLHARACLVATETYELLKGGFPHGAQARWRTLHEHAVYAAVIADQGPGVAERYLLHDVIEHADEVDTYQSKLAGRFGREPYSQEEVDQMHARRDALLKRFGRQFGGHYGWAAELFPMKPRFGFGDLEKLARLDHLRPFYDRSTHIGIHATSRGARLNVLKRGDRRFRLVGPTNIGMAEPGHGALISLVQVTTTLLIKGRPLDDPMRLVVSEALLKLTDDAGDAFLAAAKRLQAKEERFQREQANRSKSAPARRKP
jgi:hypothetical protein